MLTFKKTINKNRRSSRVCEAHLDGNEEDTVSLTNKGIFKMTGKRKHYLLKLLDDDRRKLFLKLTKKMSTNH